MRESARIAAVGAGRWGRNIIRNLGALGVLSAVVEPVEGRGRPLAERLGVPWFADLADLLAEGSSTAVVVATPPKTHATLALAAMERGLDVFVEKPMATSAADGELMVEVARELGRVLMVGHILEYHGAISALRQLVASGGLGELGYLSSSRLNSSLEGRRYDDALWTFAPHDVSLLLLLVGEMPVQVSATGGSLLRSSFADVAVLNLLFPGGLRAHVYVSWFHPFKEQKLVVTGTEAMVVFDDVVPERKLALFKKGEGQTGFGLSWSPGIEESVEYDTTEPLRVELEHFVTCHTERRRPRTDGANGLRVLEVLQASDRSMRAKGAPIAICPRSQEVTAHDDLRGRVDQVIAPLSR